MRTKQKVISGFTRLTDENLVILAQTVLEAMSDSPNFTDPEPSLEEVKEVLDNYSEKLALARKRGSPYDTATKNETRKSMERILGELAFYVNKISQGNLPMMLSSGFEVSKYRANVLSPDVVRGLILTDGRNSGQMVLAFDKLENTRLYEYRYTKEKGPDGELAWNGEVYSTTSSRNNIIEPVTPGKTYYLSVRAINTRGTGDWSEPVSWMAR